MSDDSSSLLEEERSLFRPFTRESLLAIEARIAEELEKQKELEKRRAEGEVSWLLLEHINIDTSLSLDLFYLPQPPPFIINISSLWIY